MSAAEIATVVEGWATLAGLMVVIAGAVFAGIQLRQEAKARKLLVLMSVLTDVRPPEVTRARLVMRHLPDGFVMSKLPHQQQVAVIPVGASDGRLGTLLAVSAMEEDDIFPHLTFSRGAIESWERLTHILRSGDMYSTNLAGLNITISHEQLVARAQDWLLRNDGTQFGPVPTFDANTDALQALSAQVSQTREVTS
jgi:hypothetical protein